MATSDDVDDDVPDGVAKPPPPRCLTTSDDVAVAGARDQGVSLGNPLSTLGHL